MTLVDETGTKYGRLTVLKRASSTDGRGHWLCRCDCGNILKVTISNLNNGLVKSCGCDIKTGDIFGNLVVKKI